MVVEEVDGARRKERRSRKRNREHRRQPLLYLLLYHLPLAPPRFVRPESGLRRAAGPGATPTRRRRPDGGFFKREKREVSTIDRRSVFSQWFALITPRASSPQSRAYIGLLIHGMIRSIENLTVTRRLHLWRRRDDEDSDDEDDVIVASSSEKKREKMKKKEFCFFCVL